MSLRTAKTKGYSLDQAVSPLTQDVLYSPESANIASCFHNRALPDLKNVYLARRVKAPVPGHQPDQVLLAQHPPSADLAAPLCSQTWMTAPLHT